MKVANFRSCQQAWKIFTSKKLGQISVAFQICLINGCKNYNQGGILCHFLKSQKMWRFDETKLKIFPLLQIGKK